jgi:hypothetical protein
MIQKYKTAVEDSSFLECYVALLFFSVSVTTYHYTHNNITEDFNIAVRTAYLVEIQSYSRLIKVYLLSISRVLAQPSTQ